MSLEQTRTLLRDRLRLGTAFKTANTPMTMQIAERWWHFYKDWEARDTFLGAFQEGRMTVRQIPVPEGFGTKPVGKIQDYDINYGTYGGKESSIAFGARRGEEEKKLFPNERYRVGTTALKQRMNASNFGIEGGERLKYKHGLHDLSASLCVPTIPLLTQQVRWKWGELGKRITVFMPLGKQEDMYLFHLLNAAAKAERTAVPKIYERIAEMRKRMTRIKLADSVDIGAGLRDVSAAGTNNPKFRYGMKEELVKGQLAGVDRERMQKALNYTSILPKAAKAQEAPPPTPGAGGGGAPPPPGPVTGATTSCNEVVIAYREHAGDHFPVFTKFDSVEKAFICHPDEPSSRYFVGQKIPNEWARTIGV